MKKIALIGLPGSGKSTFASKLGKVLKIPVHHLDRHQFLPCGKKRNREEFIKTQKSLLREDAWIVEGCSFSTFEMRFSTADTLIYFHFSRALCYWRLIKRLFNHKKEYGGLRSIPFELLRYIWNFHREKGERIEELQKKYPKLKFIVFKRQKSADQFLKKVKGDPFFI